MASDFVERLEIVEGYLTIVNSLIFHVIKVLEIDGKDFSEVELVYKESLSLTDNVRRLYNDSNL